MEKASLQISGCQERAWCCHRRECKECWVIEGRIRNAAAQRKPGGDLWDHYLSAVRQRYIHHTLTHIHTDTHTYMHTQTKARRNTRINNINTHTHKHTHTHTDSSEAISNHRISASEMSAAPQQVTCFHTVPRQLHPQTFINLRGKMRSDDDLVQMRCLSHTQSESGWAHAHRREDSQIHEKKKRKARWNDTREKEKKSTMEWKR